MFLNGCIQVFARTPELGVVKTRLQPELGDEGCYQLHQDLVRHAVKTAVESWIAPTEIWHTGHENHPFWIALADELSIGLCEQTGADLGERMLQAASSRLNAADPSDWVILIGSDCPGIGAEYLLAAATALESGEEIVIGPAEDGGYVLLGLRQPKEFLFREIPWGTPEVLSRTLGQAKQNDASAYLLPTLRDLDVFEDLEHYRNSQSWISSAFSL